MSELATIEPRHIEFENQAIAITKAKGGRQRRIPIDNETLEMPSITFLHQIAQWIDLSLPSQVYGCGSLLRNVDPRNTSKHFLYVDLSIRRTAKASQRLNAWLVDIPRTPYQRSKERLFEGRRQSAYRIPLCRRCKPADLSRVVDFFSHRYSL